MTGLLATWGALWFGGFLVSALFAAAGIGFHDSNTAFVTFLVRDLVFAALAWHAWRRLPAPATPRTEAGGLLDRFSLALAIALLVAYAAVTLRLGPSGGDSPLIFQQLRLRMPVRLLSFVLFQQAVNTWYLLDAARARLGDARGVAIAVALFASSHLGALMLGVSGGWIVALVVAAAAGMTLWATLRLRFGAVLAPVCLHGSFYLAAALVYALW